MDQELIGKGSCTITRMGFPKAITLYAKKGNTVIGVTTTSREFTWTTFALGILSYYTGFLWACQFPEYVEIPISKKSDWNTQFFNPWENSKSSSWEKPAKSKFK